MPLTKNFNLQSLLFALVVLISVLIGGTKKELETKLPKEIFISRTKQNISIKAPTINLSKRPGLLANLNDLGKKSPQNEPAVNAQAVLVKFLDNRALFELNSYSRWSLASLTKLMTAVVALEKIGKDKNISLSETAIDLGGSFKIFKNGDIFTVGDLLKAVLVVSRNDASAALAEFYDEKNFIKAMQEKALELDMKQTSFFEPTGLSILNQSTIKDLEKLINYIIKSHPIIFEISRQKEVEITELSSGRKIRLTNVIQFAGQSDFLGGKSGQTDEAKGNLISIFEYKNNPILIVVLGADDRFRQTQILYNWTKLIIDSSSN